MSKSIALRSIPAGEALLSAGIAQKDEVEASVPEAELVPSGNACFERWLPAALELAEEELEVLNVHVMSAISAATYAVGAAAVYVEELERLPGLGRSTLEELEELSKALCVAHARYRTTLKVPRLDPKLRVEATRMRRLLRAKAEMMLLRGQVKPEQMSRLDRRNGSLREIEELGGLLSLVRDGLGEDLERDARLAEELLEAERLHWQIVEAQAVRQFAPARRAQAASERHRMFTLFSRTYDELCRGIAFVRWREGDAGAITPALRAQPKKSRRKPTQEPAALDGEQSVTEQEQEGPWPRAPERSDSPSAGCW